MLPCLIINQYLMSYNPDIDAYGSCSPRLVTSHRFRASTIPLSDYRIVSYRAYMIELVELPSSATKKRLTQL
jgi:hypothetical protein